MIRRSQIGRSYRGIKAIVVWEFLAADVEGIESVGAVCAVFEQCSCYASDFVDDFGLYELLAGLILAVIVQHFRSVAEKEPLRQRNTPADCMARIRSSSLERLKKCMRRCLPTKP